MDGNLDLLEAGCEGGGQKVAVRSRDCHHHLPFLCVKAAVRKAGTTLGPCKCVAVFLGLRESVFNAVDRGWYCFC